MCRDLLIIQKTIAGALLLEAVVDPKKEEEGRATSVSGSKKNHFLTPVRDGGRRLKLDDDGEGNYCVGGGGGGDVVIIEPEVVKREALPRRGSGFCSFNKRKRDALVGLLDWVFRVAKNPGEFTIGKVLPSSDGGKEKGNFVVGELYSQALSARRAMFLKKIWKTDDNVASSQVVFFCGCCSVIFGMK